jgi:thymidylate kinase
VLNFYISISGLDGSGKSTLIRELTRKFESQGKPVRVIAVRLGFTPLVHGLRRLVSGRDGNQTASGQRSVAAVAPSRRKGLILEIYRLVSLLDLLLLAVWIACLRIAGVNLLMDRCFWDSANIYQDKYGKPEGLSLGLMQLSSMIAGKLDAAFFLYVPPEESHRRVLSRNQGVEQEPLELLQRRARLYQENRVPELIEVDALQSPEAVLAEVWGKIEEILDKKKKGRGVTD